MGFLAVVHVIIALVLILVVLIQDAKGGGIGAFGGQTGSNTVLGATGATSFLTKFTRYVVVVFAATCILLTKMTARDTGSALDSGVLPPAEQTETLQAPPAEEAAEEAPKSE